MKFLLVGINSKYSHSNPALYYIKEVLKLRFSDIEVVEFTIKTQFFDILDYIGERSPDVLMLSCYIWNIDYMKYLFEDIKTINKNIKLIIGGPEVSFNSEKYKKKYPDVDIIMIGNGVRATEMLLEMNFDVEDKIINGGDESHAYIPFSEEYFLKTVADGRIPYYEASRGCPFNCSYCLSSNKTQNMFFKTAETIKKELDFIVNLRPGLVKFVDRSFNINRRISHKILDYIAGIESDICFHFEIHPAYLNESDFEKLRSLPKNRIQAEIGIQSTDPKVLEAVNRKEDIKIVLENTKKLVDLHNFHQHTDMIIGLPYQDMDSAITSFNEIHELGADHFQLGFLKVLQGTEIAGRKNEFEMKFSAKPPYQILKTKWLSYDEIKYWRRIEEHLSSFSNSEQFDNTVKYLLGREERPFDFYSKITDYWIIEKLDFSNHKWTYLGKNLISFVKKIYPEHLDIIIDYLRMDWAKLASSHFFPDFLTSAQTAKMKNDYYLRIKESAFYKQRIKLQYLKKAVFVIPESEYVQTEIGNDTVGFIFYRENKKKFFNYAIKPELLYSPDKHPKP
ncbi:MAG: hypothetical protein CSB55_01450 [Candidatus Cloacimonadota bacterium]|nr:MAG: hypothetical protein CSB55_01450 [Candidatus Cloacimonadota bacterium]